MKIAFIINPTSSSGRTQTRFHQLEPEIRQHFPGSQFSFTERAGHATSLTRSAIDSGAEIIVSVGGDGTANEVANGFFGNGRALSPKTKLAILMSGTGADFRRSIGLPKDLHTALLQIKTGRTVDIDVGLVKCRKKDGSTTERYFLNAASLGLSAMAAKLVKDIPGKQSRISYLVAALKALRRAKPTTLRVVSDDTERELVDVSLITFANAAYFGGAMHIAPQASLTDGLADVVCISNVTLWMLMKNIIRLYRGTHLNLKEVTHFRAARLEVLDHGEILVEADGEPLGSLPASFEIIKGALPLIY